MENMTSWVLKSHFKAWLEHFFLLPSCSFETRHPEQLLILAEKSIATLPYMLKQGSITLTIKKAILEKF